jgi:hypothetical protein
VQQDDLRTTEALDHVMNAGLLYERYLEIARLSEIPVAGDTDTGRPEFFAPAPTPLTLTFVTR